MILSFDHRRIPRSTTRAQWREIDRWRRVTNKRLAEEAERQREDLAAALADLGTFGRAEMKAELLGRLTNPPVVYPPLTP